jgi:predicted DNA-binding protein
MPKSQRYVGLKMPEELYRRVQKSAYKAERSISDYIRIVLKNHLAEEGRPQ